MLAWCAGGNLHYGGTRHLLPAPLAMVTTVRRVPGGPALPQEYVAVNFNPLQSPQVRSYQQNALASGHCLDTDSCRPPPDELVSATFYFMRSSGALHVVQLSPI